MGIETDNQERSTDTGNQGTPGAHPVSATEQLAQLTLDSLPSWMKAPGGIQRFRLIMAVVVGIVIITLAISVLHGFSQVDLAISAPHKDM